MQTSIELKNILKRIDRRSYPAYKETKGVYGFSGYSLSIDHVQGDPFASPSKLSIRVSGGNAGFPSEMYDKKHRRIALQDELTRLFGKQTAQFSCKAKGSGKSGAISVSRCGQEVLERTACTISPENGDILMRFEVGFPAYGRTINSSELERIIFEFLPVCVKKSLIYRNLDSDRVRGVTELSDDQEYIRSMLPELGLCAFVANGSILPRESGVSARPMKGGICFKSPKELEVSLTLPHRGTIEGMGIRKGITLIVGGGYHGKSTLLKALEMGVYNHISGDGREYVITDNTAVKIRAEDGRSIKKTDISMFISNLPNGKGTVEFETEDASGSTSQAANVIEGIESGASLLLIDEDTSATNFMIRDELMQQVIHRDMEPITPFIDRIRELYERFSISTIIVAGSSGSYFRVADSIIQMDRYVPKDITCYAKNEAKRFEVHSEPAEQATLPSFKRIPKRSKEFMGNERIKIKTLSRDGVVINRETVDLRYAEQISDSEQVTALGYCIKFAHRNIIDGRKNMRQIVDEIESLIENKSLAEICENRTSVASMARPRRQEIFACFNRYRNLNL